jgi:CRP/FNR family transcriptional regulator
MLQAPEIEMIRESKTQVSFRQGENLTKQGTYASYILFILKGVTKQHLEEGGKNYNLRIVGESEFIGLSTVFGKNTFNYSTIALTDTQTLLIEKEALEKIIRQNGHFAFNIINRYCDQNDILYQSIRNLMYKQMNGRVADALLYLSTKETPTSGIFQLLTRRDIAEFAGISTESAVKILKTFERDGLIQLIDKNIVIKNKNQLDQISEKG